MGEKVTDAGQGSDESSADTGSSGAGKGDPTPDDTMVPGQLLITDVMAAIEPAVVRPALEASESVEVTEPMAALEPAEPPRALERPRPSREEPSVELVRPEPRTILGRPVPAGQDRWVDYGLALLLRDRLRSDESRPSQPLRAQPLGAPPLGTQPAQTPDQPQLPPAMADRPATTIGRRGAAHGAALPLGPQERLPLRDPAIGLPIALAVGLVAAFISWVTAGPFWLANGVGHAGTATVAGCEHRVLADVCRGKFTPDDGSFGSTVRLASLDPGQRKPGSVVRARLLHRDSEVAYAGPVAGLHLRWVLGFGLVLACGFGVGVATGVPRLRREGPQRVALLWGLSFGGPLFLLVVMLLLALV